MIYITAPIAKPPNKTVKTRKCPYQPKKLAKKQVEK